MQTKHTRNLTRIPEMALEDSVTTWTTFASSLLTALATLIEALKTDTTLDTTTTTTSTE